MNRLHKSKASRQCGYGYATSAFLSKPSYMSNMNMNKVAPSCEFGGVSSGCALRPMRMGRTGTRMAFHQYECGCASTGGHNSLFYTNSQHKCRSFGSL